MLQSLDEFDLKIAAEIASAFPEWMPLATVEESHGDRALVISVEPPSRNVSYPLRIDTFRRECTVSFDHFHAHFDEFANGTECDALTLIRELVSGKCVVVSYWRDEKWCGSMLFEADRIPKDNSEQPHANRVRVRSWTGVFDNDIECTPRD